MPKLIYIILIGILSSKINSISSIEIPIKIIQDVIYNKNMFHYPEITDIEIYEINKIYVKLFTKLVNIYSKEIIQECKKLDKKPKTGCTMRISYYSVVKSCDSQCNYRNSDDKMNEYIIWQSKSNECKIIKINILNLYTPLLDEKDRLILESYDYTKIFQSTKKVYFFIPSLSNVNIIKYTTPCQIIKNTHRCYKNKSLEMIILLTQYYSYGIFSKVCEYIYDELNPKITNILIKKVL